MHVWDYRRNNEKKKEGSRVEETTMPMRKLETYVLMIKEMKHRGKVYNQEE
jgi:hypothetical protein